MTHYSYIDELNKKAKHVRFYWLAFIMLVSVAIISLLVIIRLETNFFKFVQEKKSLLSQEDKLKIEKRLLASYARRDLGLEDKNDIERVLGAGTEAREISTEKKMEIENRLSQ